MSDVLRTLSPVDGSLVVERPWATAAALERALARAEEASRLWRRVPLEQRIAKVGAWVDAIEAAAPSLAAELTQQMGRPIRYAPGELAGFAHRARTMMRLAPEALADVVPTPQPGFTRFIRHEAVGVVLVLAPWNYPWLTAVNTLAPALVAGNVVLLKHADQTPLVAERLADAAAKAGIPDGVFQFLHMTHELTAAAVRDPRVAHVAFTGSVAGGAAVHGAAGGTFKTVGLELGGNDAAYVRADANVAWSAVQLADGAFFNSGQSCCGIERIYVDATIYQPFVDALVAEAEALVLGDPTDPATTLGPIVRPRNAADIQAQIDAALAGGARQLVDHARFTATERGLPYLAPSVLVDVPDEAEVHREETFGPVVVVLPVSGDDEAVRRINDSRYGLTAGVWSTDLEGGQEVATRLDAGTVFLNRCDHLDPELAWVGVRDSGRGVTLSRLGYDSLTRPKSFHLRHPEGA